MTASLTTRRIPSLVPTRDERVDLGFLLALLLLGLYGFRTTYGGYTFFAVGAVAAILGMAISHLADRLGQPVVAEAAVTVVIFFVVGGALAAPGSALGGLVPTSSTLSSLATASTHGWKELLTTPAPIGDTSNLLTIPYLVSLVGGVAGAGLARRTTVPALPLAAPVGVLALSILFGATHAASLLVQGSLFGVAALAWVMMRSQRRRTVIRSGGQRRSQVAAAAGLLAVAALLATAVGPNLPFTGHRRVVLSRYVVPPFDVNALASPLGAFRKYTPGAPQTLADKTLFTISGLRSGARVRIATMDSYNDLVWGFGGEASSATATSGDVFRRYGTSIPVTQPGTPGTISVKMGDLGLVWLPDVGQVTSIRFSGDDAGRLGIGFRYDQATGTGADPTVLAPGQTYKLGVVVPKAPSPKQLRAAAAGPEVTATAVPTVLQAAASQWVNGTTGAWAKVTKLASVLQTTGKFSDGTEDPPLSQPGHSEGRLTGFLQGGPSIGTQIVGDDEQYAAALALMSNAVGVPARVVLGAVVGASGVPTRADVHPWVGVWLGGLGWVPVDYSTFLPTQHPVQVLPQPLPLNQTQTPVAPPTVSVLQPPPDDVLPQSPAPSARSLRTNRHAHGSFQIPGWVVSGAEDIGFAAAVVVAVSVLIIGAKALRRRRRRRRGPATTRIAGGWVELLDQARDAGHPVPTARTRPEQAGYVPTPASVLLASSADGAIFGPDDPTPDEVAGFWRQVNEAGRALRRGGGWRARLKAELSLASFRRGRPGPVTP